MSISRGRWITFLDADDTFVPGFIRQSVSFGEKHDCDMVSCSVGFQDKEYLQVKWAIKPERQVSSLTASQDHINWTWQHSTAWGRIYKRDFILKNEIRFTDFFFYEDEEFIHKAYACAKKHWFSSIKLVIQCRSSSDSVMRSAKISKKKFLSMFVHIDRISDIISKYYDKDESKILRMAIARFMFKKYHFSRMVVLSYIKYCKVNRLPSPLTNEVLSMLVKIPEIMPEVLKIYACEYCVKG